MPARTTDADVRAIIEAETSIDMTPFIATANLLVTRCCVTNSPLGDLTTYTFDDLEMIERWLSAHFYAVRDNRRASEQVGSVQEAFQYKVGLNLNVTIYGQQALILDTEGGLARAQKVAEKGAAPTVGVTWLGNADERGDAAPIEGLT